MGTQDNLGAIQHAGRDLLTRLPDRAAALDVLAQWQEHANDHEQGRPSTPIHAMLIRLGRFSSVNLAFGVAGGDAALADVGARIESFAREEFERDWLVAWLGGGMFLLAARADCARAHWQWLSEELALVIAQPIALPALPCALRLWPRIALMRASPGQSPRSLLAQLDEALEAGPAHGATRVMWVDGTALPPARSARQLAADLLGALEGDEIRIVFQPQYSCRSGAMIGAEALARWQHPVLGRIGAGALLAIAERADQIGPLSRRIIALALQEAGQCPGLPGLSLNITATDLAARDFADWLARSARRAGVTPDRLSLEITEQALLGDLDQSTRRLMPLVEQGARIALDDFGAGYCNFRYLKRLPISILKLDRSMLDGVTHSAQDLAVLRAILALGKALGLEVFAEGIERDDQLALIGREGCAAWQGFLGGGPMPPAELATLAAGGGRRGATSWRD